MRRDYQLEPVEIGDYSAPVRRNSGKKLCKTCKTRLNSYNMSDYCSLHWLAASMEEAIEKDMEVERRFQHQRAAQWRRRQDRARLGTSRRGL